VAGGWALEGFGKADIGFQVRGAIYLAFTVKEYSGILSANSALSKSILQQLMRLAGHEGARSPPTAIYNKYLPCRLGRPIRYPLGGPEDLPMNANQGSTQSSKAVHNPASYFA
jgi:hypothetical protein